MVCPLAPLPEELSYYGKLQNYSAMANKHIRFESLHISSGLGRETGWRVSAKTRLLATPMIAFYPLGTPSSIVMKRFI